MTDTQKIEAIREAYAEFQMKVKQLKETYREKVKKVLAEIDEEKLKDIKRALGLPHDG